MEYATIQTGTISHQGEIIAAHADGRVCVDTGGHIHCGTLVPRHVRMREKARVVSPSAASASGHAIKTAGAALLASAMAFANPVAAYPVPQDERACDVLQNVLTYLVAEFGELPLVAGDITDASRSRGIAVAMNPETRTWTMIETLHPSEWTCVVAYGTGAGSPWEDQ